MRKILFSALLAGTMVAAAPASAQAWRGQPAQYNQVQSNQIRQEISQLQNQIARAQQNRRISAREANALRRQAATVQRNYSLYSRNGLDRREVNALQQQVQQIRRNLQVERRDADRRRG
jgi:predicted RNase H-like nuclease (RuvC/YqgF family)